jgi:AbrB family looped-hinge helix DNA binding protein
MRENVVISDRGQLTLPVNIRRRLGIKPGSVVTVEDRNGEIVLRPAAVVEIELYSDDQVREWDTADAFRTGERKMLKQVITNARSRKGIS